MKIYFYKVPDDSESQYRGIGFYTNYLIQALQKKGVEIKFFSNEKKVKKDSDAVVHYPWLHPYFLTAPLSKKHKRVITVHDLIPLKFPKLYPPGLRARFAWQINKRIIKQADVIITDSLTSKNDVLRFCWPISEEKIHIIPLAVDSVYKPIKKPTRPSFLNSKTFKVSNSKFVLYVGDANPSKNLPTLIKACLDLKAPLVLVGNKLAQKEYDRLHPENQDLVFVQKMAKKYPKMIVLPGFISKKDLSNLYNLATLYCQPSFEEGFGLPVLEAMSCGCPVAVSQTSALVELTKTDAFLFDPNSLDSLKRCLQEALKDKSKQQKYASLGLKKAKQYSWQKTARKTVEVYRQLLDNIV